MNHVLLIRHGATAGNLERRYIGRTDEPLCEQGVSQIRRLKTQGLSADRVFVSPALRARQTAGLLFPQIRPVVLADLRETDFGAFEGKNALELENDPDYRAWVEAGCQTPPPGGEDIGDFKARCCQTFCAVMAQLPKGEKVAFVLHGGSIMAILETFARPRRDFYEYHVENGGFFACRYRAGILRII